MKNFRRLRIIEKIPQKDAPNGLRGEMIESQK